MKNNLFLIILISLLVFGGSFLAGMKYQESKNPASRLSETRRPQSLRNQGLRPVNGEIINIEEDTLTVKISDGSSKIIFLPEKLNLTKSSPGSKKDLEKGKKVAIFGTENPDGSLVAQSIQLNPFFQNNRINR